MAYTPKFFLRAVYEFETEADMLANKKRILKADIAGEITLKDLSSYKE